MKIKVKPVLALPERLDVIDIEILDEVLTITAVSTQVHPCCPLCGTPALRVHSCSTRQITDLPCSRQQVHALTLEQVIITPSETRLFIHWQKNDLQPPVFALPGGPPGPATYTQTLYNLQLSTQEQTYPICLVGGGVPCRAGFGPGPYDTGSSITGTGLSFTGPNLLNQDRQTIGFSLFQPLSKQHGIWTLTITRYTMPMTKNGSTASPSMDTTAKPWIFTFRVP